MSIQKTHEIKIILITIKLIFHHQVRPKKEKNKREQK